MPFALEIAYGRSYGSRNISHRVVSGPCRIIKQHFKDEGFGDSNAPEAPSRAAFEDYTTTEPPANGIG